ncbi:hypothetical protein JXA80_07640 [bacterium]|nr:hypothetical protein [candidate division CSSED10-310 bacterium]
MKHWLTMFSVLLLPSAVLAMPFPWLPVENAPGNLIGIFSDYNQGHVYLAVSQSGDLYRSSDSGDTWSPLPLPGGHAVVFLSRDPSQKTSWYAVTNSGTGFDIWYSTDNGTSWQYRSGQSERIVYISPSPIAHGYLLFATGAADSASLQLNKSEDGGVTHHSVLMMNDPGFAPVWHTTSSWQAHWGRMLSSDYGESWTDNSDKTIAACGNDIPPSLLAPTQEGLFRSRDTTNTWWPLLLKPTDFVSINPRNSNMLITGSIRSDSPNLYYSNDGGNRFAEWSSDTPGTIQTVIIGSDWMFFTIINGALYRYDERPADLDQSNRIDGGDLVIMATAFGTHAGDAAFNTIADLNHDGTIDGNDLVILSAVFGHRFEYEDHDSPGDFPAD